MCIRPSENCLRVSTDNSSLWHRRLKHASYDVILQSRQITYGIQKFNSSEKHHCQDCQLSKSTAKPHPIRSSESKNSTELGDLVHTDLVSSNTVPSLGGSRYYITVLDDATGISLVRFLKNKSDAFQPLTEMINILSTLAEKQVKRIRMDNGGEYTSNTLEEWMKEKGIQFEYTAAYNPQSNGKAERLNRSLNDAARSMLSAVSVNQGYLRLWAEAVETANYIRNRLLTVSNREGITPFEAAYHKKPNLSYIRVFGCKAYVNIHQHKRNGKFTQRAKIVILVGFTRGDAYKIYYPEEKKMDISRDVTFDEDNLSWNMTNTESDGCHKMDINTLFRPISNPGLNDGESVPKLENQTENVQIGDQNNYESETETENTEEQLTYYPPDNRSSGRTRSVPQRYTPDAYIALLTRMALGITDSDLSDTYKQALQHCEKSEWLTAAATEMDDLKRRGVIELVPPPENAKALPCRWVFDRKRDNAGNILRHRARVVAKGFKQKFGINFVEIFAPVVRYTTVRIVFAMVTEYMWVIIRIDVRRAFLYGKLEEIIFMEQPDGFVVVGKENWVYRLWKSIYGLKQSPRSWRKELVIILTEIGAEVSKADPALFTVKRGSTFIIIIVYVDDLLFTGNNESHIRPFIERIGKRLEIRVEPEE